MSSQAGFQTH